MEVSSILVKPIDRLSQLMLLAISVLVYSVVAIAIANSLFITHVGAENLPIAFICIGLCSFPAYALFSQIIDRYSRPQLFRYILIISIFVILGLRFLLTFDNSTVYYILLIAIFFQWDFHNNILYPGLLTDYFTSLEYKRYAPYIGIAQAVGAMLGGGVTIVLTNYFKTRDLLFCLPIIFLITFWQLIYLEKSQRRLEKIETSSKIGIIESLKTFPDIVKRYPIVLFLASSSFLLVIIYICSEFLWFNIYSQYFTEEELTSFLGLMRIVVSLVQVIVLYVLIRPLLTKLGVAKMNPVYPLTTLATFCGLIFNFGLGTGIALQLNGDALYKSVNLPVHQLNYNSIPPEFMGRVRTLSDGIIYSVGLTLAGVVLWFCHHLNLSLTQITWLAMSLTFVLLLIRLPMGKYYAQGLEDMIRSDTIYLDEFSLLQQTKLPANSSIAIGELLTNDDRYIQLKGLELASKLNNPLQFLPEIKQLLLTGESSLRQGVVHLFSHNHDQETIDRLKNILDTSTDSILRATALEILIINQYNFNEDEDRVNLLLQDKDTQIKILAGVAIIQNDRFSEEKITTGWQIIKGYSLSEETIKAIIRIIIYTHPNYQANLSSISQQLGLPEKGFLSSFISGFNAPEFDNCEHQLLEFIQEILPQVSVETKQEALKGLSKITTNNNDNLVKLALQEITHPEAEIRIAAFKLLASNPDSTMLPHIKTGLVDHRLQVRQQVAQTLPLYGEEGLALAQKNLASEEKPIVDTAIWAIAQYKTRQANDILYEYLTPEFEQLNRSRKWQEKIPSHDPHWQLLAIAIDDFHQRLINKVLYILSCLGYSRTVDAVTRILTTNNQTDLANAVELLVSLPHRRFVLPLVPLLEKMVQPPPPVESQIKVNPKWLRKKGYQVLLEALESKQRWMSIGALVALTMIPSTLLQDNDKIVRAIASQMFPHSTQLISPNNLSMNRLLLLKNVALFKNLSLDELFLIDQALEQQQVLSGEVIYTEGSWGEYLYIIAQGTVRIVKNIDGEEKEIRVLSQGQYFGEIALFDNATRWDGTIAIEDCTLLKLEKKRFISLITQRPHIILEICRFLSQRLRETDKYISSSKN